MYTDPDLLVFVSAICNMSHHAVCKCFGLAVGEDVYDLQLPSVSRIPDIDNTVDLMLFAIFGSLFYHLYIFHLLSVLCTTTLLTLLCVTLLHPHSPPDVFLLFCICTRSS